MRAKPSERRLFDNRIKEDRSAGLLRRRAVSGLIIGALLIPALPATAEIVVEPTAPSNEETTSADLSSNESTTDTSVTPVADLYDNPDSESPEEVATSSIIVKMVAGLDSEAQDAVIARHGGVETSTISALRLHVVEVPTADLDAAIASYRADADVANVSLDRTREVETAASDPGYGSQWALPQIGWDQVHGEVELSGSVKIAVLDTGVAAIDELDGRLGAGYSAFGTNPTNDVNGHGTQMASIVAAATNNGAGIAGVAYGDVSVMPVQVLDANGEGSDSDIIEGLVWAVDNGADVALMAFSNPGYSAALQDAINYAWYNGVVVVAAAGNDGSTSATYPAGSSKVIGVGGSTSSDNVWSASNRSDAVYLTAPAVGISAIDAAGDMVSVSGTSASAAIVAGAAAVLRGADASATNTVIVGRLARNAEPLVDSSLGNGRVDLARAVADTSTDGVTPMGVAGSGGPVVGPYSTAAKPDSVTSPSANEGNSGPSTLTFSIVTSGTASTQFWRTNGGTATGGPACTTGVDYIWVSSSGSKSGTYTVDVTVCGDTTSESNETVIFEAADKSFGSGGITLKSGTGTITDDDTPPSVTSVTRVSAASRSTSSMSWTVTFSRPVLNVDALDFEAVITAGDLAVGALSVSGSGATYTVSTARTSGQGTVRLDVLNNGTIQDANSLALSAGFTSGDTITFDSVVPTVSIARVSNEFVRTGPVTWELTFSEVVTGFDINDFASVNVSGSCSGGSTPALGSLTQQSDLTNWRVSSPIGNSGDCVLVASLIASPSVSDAAGNALAGPVTGPTITVDRTLPTATSIVRNNPSPTSASSVSWTVTFSEPVSDVAIANDFFLTATGVSGASISSVAVSGGGSEPATAFVVTASTGTGSGTLRLDIPNTRTINDRAGNAMNSTLTGEVYSLDRAAPRVSSIARVESSPTSASTVSWTVVFSKAVSGVDATDFQLASTGGVSGASISSVAVSPSGSQPASTFVVTASTGTGSGTLGLNLVDNDSIVDDGAQSLVGSGSALDGSVSGPTFTLDRESPTVSSITRTVTSPTRANSIGWTVVFSEGVNGVNASDFDVVTTGTVPDVAPTVTGTAGGTSYTVTFTISSGEGDVQLNVLDDDTIVDVSLNKLGGDGAANGAFQGTTAVYVVDRTAPTTLSIVRYDPTTLYSSKQAIQWLVTFSEPVNAVDKDDFVLSEFDTEYGNAPRIRGEAITSVAPLAGSAPSATWIVTVDTGKRNGGLCLTQKIDNRAEIADIAGNIITSVFTSSCQPTVGVCGPVDRPYLCPPADSFIVAKDAPFVVSISRTASEPNTNAETASWTVVFSEPVGGDLSSDGVTANDFLLASMVEDVNRVLVLTDGVAGTGILTPVAVNSAPDASGVLRATTWTITGTLTDLNEGQVLLVLKDNDTIVNASEIELRSSVSTVNNTNIDGTFRLGQSYTIDRTAPDLTIDNIGAFGLDMTNRPSDVFGARGALASDNPSVTLEFFAGQTIDVGEIPVDTDEDDRTNSTSWKSIIAGQGLDQGWFTLRASQSDKAGNTKVVEKTFLIDDVNPTIDFSGVQPQSLTNDGLQTWTVSYAEGVGPEEASGINGVVCSLNGADFVTCPTGASATAFSVSSTSAGITVQIDEGCNTFDIRVYDNAGNQTTITWNGVLDSTAPVVTLGAPTDETYTNDITPQATGTAGTAIPTGCPFPAPDDVLGAPSTDNDTVILRLVEGQVTESQMDVLSAGSSTTFEVGLDGGVFDEEIPVVAEELAVTAGLAEGWYSLRAEQSDDAGNIGYSDVVWFLVDTTDPSVDFTAVKPDVETEETTALFKFERDDLPGSGANAVASEFDESESFALCRLDSDNVEDWLPCEDEETFFDEVTTASSNEGPHTLEVKVVDRAGNESDVENYEWLIDITPPDLEITSAPTDPTIITGSNATAPSVFAFVANDPDPDVDVNGPAIPSEVEEMLCKLDTGSFVDCDSDTGELYDPLGIGRHTFTVKSVDGAGNETEAEHVWDIQANRTVLYTGSYLVTKPGTIALAATITSAADECKSDIEVAFSVKLDGFEKFAGTAVSNISGVATLISPATTDPNWPEGVYDIEIDIPMSENCTGATDQGSVTVASLGSAATGGGHYTSSGIGRVNFGLSINRVPNTNPSQFRGQVLIQNNGKWRLKGSINNYLKLSTISGLKGSASGIGTLQKWDDSIGAWVAVATNVAFSVIFEDNGSRRGIDKFTVNNIAYRPEGLTLGAKWLPTSTAEGLKGGDIRIT